MSIYWAPFHLDQVGAIKTTTNINKKEYKQHAQQNIQKELYRIYRKTRPDHYLFSIIPAESLVVLTFVGVIWPWWSYQICYDQNFHDGDWIIWRQFLDNLWPLKLIYLFYSLNSCFHTATHLQNVYNMWPSTTKPV